MTFGDIGILLQENWIVDIYCEKRCSMFYVLAEEFIEIIHATGRQKLRPLIVSLAKGRLKQFGKKFHKREENSLVSRLKKNNIATKELFLPSQPRYQVAGRRLSAFLLGGIGINKENGSEELYSSSQESSSLLSFRQQLQKARSMMTQHKETMESNLENKSQDTTIEKTISWKQKRLLLAQGFTTKKNNQKANERVAEFFMEMKEELLMNIDRVEEKICDLKKNNAVQMKSLSFSQ